ncbi:hypothetical protein Hanom_Chr16g01519021 [Helianthus anomalus]
MRCIAISQDEFEALCEETKVDDILGSIEELVEEQTLDHLYLDKYASHILIINTD